MIYIYIKKTILPRKRALMRFYVLPALEQLKKIKILVILAENTYWQIIKNLKIVTTLISRMDGDPDLKHAKIFKHSRECY